MCSNPCECELTCFRPESNLGPYGLLNFSSAALSTTELWWRMNHRKSHFALLLFLFSPQVIIGQNLGASVYKRMARTMVNHKLSIHFPNCRGWPWVWVPPSVRSTHAGLAAARWPMHAAWRCRQKNHASAIKTHIDRVALQLIYWLEWQNGAVGLEHSKQRLLVTIGKVAAQARAKSVIHMGRKNEPKTRVSARLWEDELGNGNAVHPEVQNTNWEDWGIACRRWASCVGPWCTRLKSDVDRWRGYEERHNNLKKDRVRKCWRFTKDSRRP